MNIKIKKLKKLEFINKEVSNRRTLDQVKAEHEWISKRAADQKQLKI